MQMLKLAWATDVGRLVITQKKKKKKRLSLIIKPEEGAEKVSFLLRKYKSNLIHCKFLTASFTRAGKQGKPNPTEPYFLH